MGKVSGFIILCTFVLISCSPNVHAQWKQTSIPATGVVNAFIGNGGFLFAGTENGVFVSTDTGATWNIANNGLSDTVITSFATNGTSVFAGTFGDGVFQSIDNGAHWTPVNNGIAMQKILSLTTIGGNIIAGTWGSGAYVSTDNGQHWSSVKGINDTIITALGIDNGNIYAASEYTADVYLSSNDGITWTVIGNSWQWSLIAIKAITASNGNVYVGVDGGGIYGTTNNGSNWFADNNGLNYSYVYALTANNGDLFAGTYGYSPLYGGGIYASTDNGASWKMVTTGLANTDILSLSAYGGYLFAGTYMGGVWRRPLSEMVP